MANRYWLRQSTSTSFVLTAVAYLADSFDYAGYLTAIRAFSRNELRVSTLPSPLRHFISNIIFVTAEKQVLGINADRVIAVMKNVHGFIKLTVFKFIANPVRSSVLAFQPKLAVQFRLSAPSFAQPSPTFIGSFFIYFTPEAFNIRGVHRHRIAYPRGVSQ